MDSKYWGHTLFRLQNQSIFLSVRIFNPPFCRKLRQFINMYYLSGISAEINEDVIYSGIIWQNQRLLSWNEDFMATFAISGKWHKLKQKCTSLLYRGFLVIESLPAATFWISKPSEYCLEWVVKKGDRRNTERSDAGWYYNWGNGTSICKTQLRICGPWLWGAGATAPAVLYHWGKIKWISCSAPSMRFWTTAKLIKSGQIQIISATRRIAVGLLRGNFMKTGIASAHQHPRENGPRMVLWICCHNSERCCFDFVAVHWMIGKQSCKHAQCWFLKSFSRI